MRPVLTAALLATTMLACPATAHAQAMTAEEAAALRAELAALKAQVQTLEARLDAATAVPPPVPTPPPVAPSVSAKPATEISWKGAPELKTADGWSFKPRGRAQFDVASIDAPAGVTGTHGGVATELRRLFLGVDGKIPGGFSYRAEVNLADNNVELTDVYLTYGPGPLSVTVGQNKPFWGLDELTSDLFTTLSERAAFTQAFGFERRLGLSAQYRGKDVLLQGGVYSDNITDLTNDANNSVSFDGRAVFMPKLGATQLHFAGSAHFRSLNDQATSVRYRTRPFVHTTDVRLVDTGNISATGERGLGLELTAQNGPFHASAEGWWQTVRRPGLADPTFFGGYVEAGMVLTGGDARSYRDGVFDRLKPSTPITAGGIGAVELNARYDTLDLNNAGITGGRQRMLGASLVWVPVDYVRISGNYGRLWLRDAAVATATGDRNYGADVFALRTQLDF